MTLVVEPEAPLSEGRRNLANVARPGLPSVIRPIGILVIVGSALQIHRRPLVLCGALLVTTALIARTATTAFARRTRVLLAFAALSAAVGAGLSAVALLPGSDPRTWILVVLVAMLVGSSSLTAACGSEALGDRHLATDWFRVARLWAGSAVLLGAALGLQALAGERAESFADDRFANSFLGRNPTTGSTVLTVGVLCLMVTGGWMTRRVLNASLAVGDEADSYA